MRTQRNIAEGSSEGRFQYSKEFRILCIMLAGLLLFAAVAKGFDLASAGLERLHHPWEAVILLAVVAEVFLGVWLLLGVYPILAHRVSILFFAVLAAFSAYELIVGESTCRCFGRLSTSPWMTLLLDGTILIALVVIRPVSQGLCKP
ncbi:MAG: hypothetical protein NTW96_26540 [Planctomycetia bacterium]|nr:hypothetical protein [Planctomycetia bacterium]